MRVALILACAFLITGCTGPEKPDSVAPRYDRLAPCKRPPDALVGQIYDESLCGTVSVFEDRSRRDGRKIDLNVMLIRAIDTVPDPDPIFFLDGGPGQAATSDGPALFAQLDVLRKRRDIVLVDQRGTGKSNSLACELPEPEDAYFGSTLDEITRLQVSTLKDCLKRYDANPALYTTPVAMDDLDEVREYLGYEKINLYGVSYGTRAALVYLRRHPDHVRSVVLDSVVPLDMSIPAHVAIDAQAAFDRMLADCRNQSPCNTAFPDLADEFAMLRKRLELAPEKVEVRHPVTGKRISGIIGPNILSRLIRGVLYERRLASLLPVAIHEAYEHNYEPIVAMSFTLSPEGSGMSIGMMASVLCSEDMRLITEPGDTSDFDNAIYNTLAPICEFWPKGTIPDDYFQPVTSDLPVLLLSGTLDPITPPRYGEMASRTLSNARHIIVAGVGHFVSIEGCVRNVIGDFIDSADPAGVDASCTGDIQRPLFFTNLSGTGFPDD